MSHHSTVSFIYMTSEHKHSLNKDTSESARRPSSSVLKPPLDRLPIVRLGLLAARVLDPEVPRPLLRPVQGLASRLALKVGDGCWALAVRGDALLKPVMKRDLSALRGRSR